MLYYDITYCYIISITEDGLCNISSSSFLIPSISVPPLPLFKSFLRSSLVAATNANDADDDTDEYNFTTTPDASVFIACHSLSLS